MLGVVHPEFVPLQNRAGAELFHSLLDLGEHRYHTGGYLRDGEVVWLLAKLPDEIVVTESDRLETFLLYSNSHDGSQAIDIRLTTVRVVCRNTLSLALGRDAIHAPFRRAHRHTPRILQREAEAFFVSVRQRIDETQALFRRLHATPCDDVAFARFLRQLLPDPQPPMGASIDGPLARAHATRVANLARTRAAIVDVRRHGIPAEDVPPEPATWWGSVNAVTAWVDHAQDIDGDRYAHALFGSGDRIKSRALALVMSNFLKNLLVHNTTF